jgi:arsenate reductase
MSAERPTVLFLCVHNAGRSQMAMGWFEHLAGGAVRVTSAGSEPADAVNPLAVEAMAEAGIDISGAAPARWTNEQVREADVVVTMGCGDECPFYPGKRYEDWQVEDPHGADLETVRRVRDDIRGRVETLMKSLDLPAD